jgi:2-amino-4-hydroxy-6-hydroxymethyldihydropteridine diphosphokinase
MSKVFIGLGSNLGDSVAHLLQARSALANLADSQVLATSSLYRSAPIGPQDQADFFNAALCLESTLSPSALLAALQEIEQQAGRVRTRHWGERTLDLDILLYGNEIVDQADLSIPHPRLHERAFVLLPLLEIAADLQLPNGQPLQSYCAAVSDQSICRHDDQRWSVAP